MAVYQDYEIRINLNELIESRIHCCDLLHPDHCLTEQQVAEIAVESSNHIYGMFLDYRDEEDFIGMDMCRKFLEMGFTRSRRYANHRDGKKYDKEGNVIPQEEDHATCHFAKSAQIFKKVRDLVAKSPTYVTMRKKWRNNE